ncbi:uncharacterized protein [Drosophila pseudoobscura]|uniref:Uncharacterized protein n=1 Tax=Drosophila pseudoobscura pseudoobscura TaxID=46245 RepID=A0A0R3P2J9_DROPS|nr:uncharacterized protein LOC26532026 [Drosophila pseudoobscura]
MRQEMWALHNAVQSGWSDRRGPPDDPGLGQICVAMVASSHEVQENHPCVDSDAPCVQRKHLRIGTHGLPAAVMTLVDWTPLDASCRDDAHGGASEERLETPPVVASVFSRASGIPTKTNTGSLD